MDATAIFATIEKGLGIVNTLIAAEQSAEPAIKVLVDLAKDGQGGTVTEQKLADTEAALDALIDDFNAPMT